ncbi:hypothetical protein D9619_008565 [Psilocybe cf. subviscida]|uniref:DUF6534 domain-containing protein n=1 Tax=Psilocybe cf. subviscida TaxID=2480587 RepID=A0A8H5BA74_9AGAR|nr:hypothetical protein D9619_008565 [Psilocybe cf. subviscida]
MFNWALFGTLSVQVYLYSMSFPNDVTLLKCLVFGIYLFEMTQTLLVTRDMFAIFASGWGDLDQLQSAQWIWISIPIMSGIVSCVVQLFYAYRLSILSRSRILGCIIGVLSITQATSAIVCGIQVASVDTLAKIQTVAHISTTIWLSGSAICDLTVAIFMSYHLSRENPAFKETQMLINRLVRLTVETGVATATVAAIDVILFLAFPESNYHITPAYTIAKLYSNSLVMVLNARSRTTAGRDHISAGEVLELRGSKRIVGMEARGLRAIRVTTTSRQAADESDKPTFKPAEAPYL